jgi:hypothetical protein
MQNTDVMGSQRLPPRFQRKALEARQYVAGSGSLQAAPDGVMWEAVRMKPKMQWKS